MTKYTLLRPENDEKGAEKYMYSPAYVWAKIILYLEERLNALTISASFDDAEIISLTEEEIIIYSHNNNAHNPVPILRR